jgi:hypothetical protein
MKLVGYYSADEDGEEVDHHFHSSEQRYDRRHDQRRDLY